MYADLRKCEEDLRNRTWKDEEDLYAIARLVYNTQIKGEDPNFVLWIDEMIDMLNDLGWTKRKVFSIQWRKK